MGPGFKVRDATLGVVGAGAMGAGIAQSALSAGLKVILFDANAAALTKAKQDIVARLARLAEKRQAPPDTVSSATQRLTLADSLTDFAPAQIIIEAIVERLQPKQDLFCQLEAVVAPQALLATNTSSLSVAAIGARCRHQDRILGLHFFNPVPLMKLVEVIGAPGTSAEVVDSGCALVQALGKTAVKVKDGPGFLVNLGGRAYTTEALHIVQEGVAEVSTIDRIMREGAGFRMGPFELLDLTGIDVNFPVSTFIHAGYQFDPRLKTTALHELMFNAGRFGRKTGVGFHRYGSEPAQPQAPVVPPPAKGDDFAAMLPDGCAALAAFGRERGLSIDASAGISLVAPQGEDAASAAARLGIAPEKIVAVDLSTLDRNLVTLMAPVGHGGAAIGRVASWLRSWGLQVEVIKDSPGFVVPRIIAMIANLGCEMAQIGVGTPEDIDTAMKLGLNYPRGSLEFAASWGPHTLLAILTGLQSTTGSDRYRPSLWLRRRALLQRSIYERD